MTGFERNENSMKAVFSSDLIASGRDESLAALDELASKETGFPIKDGNAISFYFTKKGSGYFLGINNTRDFKPSPLAGEVSVNPDGSVSIHGYKTYALPVADKSGDYARKNGLLREVTLTIPEDEWLSKGRSFNYKLENYYDGFGYPEDGFEIKRLR